MENEININGDISCKLKTEQGGSNISGKEMGKSLQGRTQTMKVQVHLTN